MANLGQNHPNSHAKFNLPGYLYVMNYNFVNTEPINLKFCCKLLFSRIAIFFPKFPNFAIILPPPHVQNQILFTSGFIGLAREETVEERTGH